MKWWMISFYLAACGSSPSTGTPVDGSLAGDSGGSNGSNGPHDAPPSSAHRTIFVIPMENESSSSIYANTNAPYINNTLMPEAAYATAFMDELDAIYPSEPHYVWMEAGTNSFSDVTFFTDGDASAGNATASTDHLTAQLNAAHIDWMSYQEGITASTCPIASISGTNYAAKHDPMIFFKDISGSPPAANTADCIAHHKPYSAFAADLAAGTMPPYVFITPNLCNDMHGAVSCASGTNATNNIKAGDTWLSTEMPRILAYAASTDSIVYLVWDEGSNNQTIPFLAFGNHVKKGPNATAYTHSSQVKTIEEQLGVPVLAKVTSANDFASMFDQFP